MLRDFLDEYARYKAIGQKALDQVPDAALNHIPSQDGNSVAMLVRHISGNLISRFTDFLHADGEKPWRQRDQEFEAKDYTRAEVQEMWTKGWAVLEAELGALKDADLTATVVIRGQKLSVHEALARSLAHVAYHIGQIVLLARMLHESSWRWISIPKGGSQAYNQNPSMEKKPQ
ncbi:MAG: DUF1572 family protein [Planctomycetota bacterium]